MVHTSVEGSRGLRKTLHVNLPGSDWVIPASADKTEIYRCLTILYVRRALECVGIYLTNSKVAVVNGRDGTCFISSWVRVSVAAQLIPGTGNDRDPKLDQPP